MVQSNLGPEYALAKDISDLKQRAGRLEQADINLSALHDVQVSLPTNGQTLSWSSAVQRWINATGGGGGSFTVSATAPASPSNGAGWWNLSNGLIFFYINDGDSSQWVQDVSIANDAGLDSRVTALETFNTVAQPVNVGGTGATSLASGGYLKGAGTSAITSQSGIPATDITSGTLNAARLPTIPIANGGTGAVTGAGMIPMVPTSINVTAGTATASGGGLVTLTNATGISLNGVFNSTYRNYRLLIEITSASPPAASFRLRNAGTDASGANYSWFGYRAINWSGAAGLNGTTSGTTWETFDTYSGASTAVVSMDIMSPAATARTRMTSSGYFLGNSIGSSYYNGSHDVVQSYDGISFPTTVAVTGTIQVLAYGS